MGTKLAHFLTKKRQIIALIYSIFLLIACENSKSITAEEIKESLHDLSLNAEVNMKKETDKLNIDMVFESPQYFDEETKKIILGLFIYNSYESLREFQKVTITYVNQGFEDDGKEFEYDKDNIESLYQKFYQNPIFKNLARYSIRKMTQNEILYSNMLIKQIPDYVSNFRFIGSFWLLLYNYSQSCMNENDEKELVFLIFAKTASIEGSGIDARHVKYFLTYCGHEPSKIGIN